MTTAEAAAAAALEEAGADVSPGSSGCDFCEEERALVFCRADSARLCLACDRRVHSANSVSSKHPRALICDACFSAPAFVLCSSQRRDGGQPRVLCLNCDFDATHGGTDADRSGERRPIEPYSGCPTVAEMLALFGISAEKEKSLLLEDDGGGGGWLDGGLADEGSSLLLAEAGWTWETPPILSIEDIIIPTQACHGFQTMGVPPPPKDRNESCGKHKDQILRQLRDLVKSESFVPSDLDWLRAEMESPSQQVGLGTAFSRVESATAAVVATACLPSKVLNKHCSMTDGLHAACSRDQVEMSLEESCTFVDGPSDAHGSVNDGDGLHLISKEDLTPAASPMCGLKLSGIERDTVLSRYKEKRKTRRFDKQIRYETRKVRADGRVRIRGRFAKTNRDAES